LAEELSVVVEGQRTDIVLFNDSPSFSLRELRRDVKLILDW